MSHKLAVHRAHVSLLSPHVRRPALPWHRVLLATPLPTRVANSWLGRRGHVVPVLFRTPASRSSTEPHQKRRKERKEPLRVYVLPLGVALAGVALLVVPGPALADVGAAGGHVANLGVTALHHFVSGGVAGSAGAAVVYPIDVVKTRMQAQKQSKTGARLEGSTAYANSWDCFTTILRTEGVSGMYTGLLAQLIGVWPDKAAKLSANEYMLGLLTDPVMGTVSPLGQLIAGMFAGMCQVVFSNPREIVKIQMQMISVGNSDVEGQWQKSENAPRRLVPAGLGGRRLAAPVALSVVSREEQVMSQFHQMRSVLNELGISGLYRGVSICAARDMTFSAIYFPIYGFLKACAATHGLSGLAWIMLMGTLAGIPASFCTNPIDIIKTRVHAERPGHAGRHMTTAQHTQALLEESGARSLLQGVVPRVTRTALQFGFTLVVYESINANLHWN